MSINKLHLCLRQIHIAYLKSKRNRILIKEYSDYLHEGIYKNSLSFDCVYNTISKPQFDSSTFSSLVDRLLLFPKALIRINNAFLRYRVRHRENHHCFDASEMILSSSLSEMKFFDFQKKEVLTIFKSETKLYSINEAKQIFANTYRIPKTIIVNFDRSFMIEELIPHMAYDLDEVFKQLCEGFCLHLSYYSSNIITNKEVYIDACKYYVSRFGGCDLLYDTIGSIRVFSHGDLWSSNIIFDGEKVFVTDFEHAGERFFLYDFFMFIFTEWQLNKDDRLIINYFNGKYDTYLYRMFISAGTVYDTDHRDKYFMVFIASILFDRWLGYEEIENTIKVFINKFITSYSC